MLKSAFVNFVSELEDLKALSMKIPVVRNISLCSSVVPYNNCSGLYWNDRYQSL